MAIEIRWSEEALATFDENIEYLLREWSEKEVVSFVDQTNRVLKRLEIFPESYPIGVISRKYRKAKLNKHIVLFYRYRKNAKKITLVTFGNVKQDPSKLASIPKV